MFEVGAKFKLTPTSSAYLSNVAILQFNTFSQSNYFKLYNLPNQQAIKSEQMRLYPSAPPAGSGCNLNYYFSTNFFCMHSRNGRAPTCVFFMLRGVQSLLAQTKQYFFKIKYPCLLCTHTQ